MQHSEWGPSRAGAYTKCLDYVNANRDLPEPDGDLIWAAAEGTFAHMISDTCLKRNLSAFDFVGKHQVVHNFEFTWSIDDAVLLERGLKRIRAIDGTFYGEQTVDVSEWTTTGQFGTLDRAVMGDGYVYLNDLKWGRGFAVSPVRNLQMALYALGLHKANAGFLGRDCTFVLEVDQPRIKGAGGVWTTDLQELEEIGAWIKQRVALGLDTNPSRTAGQLQCAFCRRKRAPKGCHVYDEFLVKLTEGLPPPTSLTVLERLNIIENKKMITMWLEELESLTMSEAMEGEELPNYKVVEGRRGKSKYLNNEIAEAALLDILGEKTFNKTLISPSVAAKLIDKDTWSERIEPLIDRGECKPIIVPDSDRREPLVLNIDSFMDEVEE